MFDLHDTCRTLKALQLLADVEAGKIKLAKIIKTQDYEQLVEISLYEAIIR